MATTGNNLSLRCLSIQLETTGGIDLGYLKEITILGVNSRDISLIGLEAQVMSVSAEVIRDYVNGGFISYSSWADPLYPALAPTPAVPGIKFEFECAVRDSRLVVPRSDIRQSK